MQPQAHRSGAVWLLVGLCSAALLVELAAAVITVQIGGATRLNSLSRHRDRGYRCRWDCELVGCQIDHDDDECAYDCQKVCKVPDDYAARSDGLSPKSSADEPKELELVSPGSSVRLHLPRNASARNFAIWERCAADSDTGKLTEKPFSL